MATYENLARHLLLVFQCTSILIVICTDWVDSCDPAKFQKQSVCHTDPNATWVRVVRLSQPAGDLRLACALACAKWTDCAWFGCNRTTGSCRLGSLNTFVQAWVNDTGGARCGADCGCSMLQSVAMQVAAWGSALTMNALLYEKLREAYPTAVATNGSAAGANGTSGTSGSSASGSTSGSSKSCAIL